MDLGIKGKRAIVTGGGSGIGFQTARQFLEEGARVLIAGRTKEKIEKLKKGIAPFFEPGLTELVKRNLRAGRLRALSRRRPSRCLLRDGAGDRRHRQGGRP